MCAQRQETIAPVLLTNYIPPLFVVLFNSVEYIRD